MESPKEEEAPSSSPEIVMEIVDIEINKTEKDEVEEEPLPQKDDIEKRRQRIVQLMEAHYGDLRFGSQHSFSLVKPDQNNSSGSYRKSRSEIHKDGGGTLRGRGKLWAAQRMKYRESTLISGKSLKEKLDKEKEKEEKKEREKEEKKDKEKEKNLQNLFRSTRTVQNKDLERDEEENTLSSSSSSSSVASSVALDDTSEGITGYIRMVQPKDTNISGDFTPPTPPIAPPRFIPVSEFSLPLSAVPKSRSSSPSPPSTPTTTPPSSTSSDSNPTLASSGGANISSTNLTSSLSSSLSSSPSPASYGLSKNLSAFRTPSFGSIKSLSSITKKNKSKPQVSLYIRDPPPSPLASTPRSGSGATPRTPPRPNTARNRTPPPFSATPSPSPPLSNPSPSPTIITTPSPSPSPTLTSPSSPKTSRLSTPNPIGQSTPPLQRRKTLRRDLSEGLTTTSSSPIPSKAPTPTASSSVDSLYAPPRPAPMLKKQVTQYGFYDKSPGQTPRKDSKKERREKRRKEREKEREKEKEREREKERQKERERRKKKDGPKTLDSIIVENTGSEGLDQWNKRFQKCLNILSSLPEGCPLDVRMSANSELMHLSEDFVYASHTVGKIIISEVYVPLEKKSIKPLTIGGRIGGEKYVVHNILFKFAIDSCNFFCGSESAAAKMANHELKGLMIYSSLAEEGIHLPLMALVDYRGFRLVAMSVLPVNRTTLIYGTSDGGVHVHNKNEVFSQKMQKMNTRLNLKAHTCGAQKRKTKVLYSAADVEGHLGLDGEFYLLDFSRTLPPVRPDSRFLNGHLYQLFRREFVENYVTPLCSDAFSGFVMHDKKREEHDRDVNAATEYLFSKNIPACAHQLVQHSQRNLGTVDVTGFLHKHGVNLRYIGKVASCVSQSEKSDVKIGSEKSLMLLGVEAIARVIKGEMNVKLRKKMKELMLPLEVPYRRITVSFLNLVFGRGGRAQDWWKTTLPKLLTILFSFPSSLVHPAINWRQKLLLSSEFGRKELIGRLVDLTGLCFSPLAEKKLVGEARWNGDHPLDLIDLKYLGERVKHMDIISFSQGNFFLYKAISEADPIFSASLLHQAIEKYEQSPVNSEAILKQLAAAWYQLLLKKNIANRGQLILRAKVCFQALLKVAPRNAQVVAFYGRFLALCSKEEQSLAESYLLRAMELDPGEPSLAIMYSNHLDEMGQFAIADIVLCSLRVCKPIVLPHTFTECKGTARVFFEDQTYRSVRIYSSFTTRDIIAVVLAQKKEKLPITRYLLSRVVLEQPFVEEDWEKVKDVAIPYFDNECPWLDVQRPNVHTCLFLSQIPEPEEVPISDQLGVRGRAFGIVEFMASLVANQNSLAAYFYVHPLIVSTKNLLKCLVCEGKELFRRGVSVMLWFFPLDFKEVGMLEVLKGVWEEGEVLELCRWVLDWVMKTKGRMMKHLERLETLKTFLKSNLPTDPTTPSLPVPPPPPTPLSLLDPSIDLNGGRAEAGMLYFQNYVPPDSNSEESHSQTCATDGVTSEEEDSESESESESEDESEEESESESESEESEVESEVETEKGAEGGGGMGLYCAYEIPADRKRALSKASKPKKKKESGGKRKKEQRVKKGGKKGGKGKEKEKEKEKEKDSILLDDSKKLAEQLFLCSYLLYSKITRRILLASPLKEEKVLLAIERYEKALSAWMSELFFKSSQDKSLGYFKFFTKLADHSYLLGDHMTSKCIYQFFESTEFANLHLTWRVNPEHAVCRFNYYQSKVYFCYKMGDSYVAPITRGYQDIWDLISPAFQPGKPLMEVAQELFSRTSILCPFVMDLGGEGVEEDRKKLPELDEEVMRLLMEGVFGGMGEEWGLEGGEVEGLLTLEERLLNYLGETPIIPNPTRPSFFQIPREANTISGSVSSEGEGLPLTPSGPLASSGGVTLSQLGSTGGTERETRSRGGTGVPEGLEFMFTGGADNFEMSRAGPPTAPAPFAAKKRGTQFNTFREQPVKTMAGEFPQYSYDDFGAGGGGGVGDLPTPKGGRKGTLREKKSKGARGFRERPMSTMGVSFQTVRSMGEGGGLVPEKDNKDNKDKGGKGKVETTQSGMFSPRVKKGKKEK